MSHPELQGETLDEMFSVAYEELRRLAASVRRDDPGMTLSPHGSRCPKIRVSGDRLSK